MDQFGGLPGCSVDHYLILMLDFINRQLDNNQRQPTAVFAAFVDFSKAFNRMDHNTLVTILSDLNIPTCALASSSLTFPIVKCVSVTTGPCLQNKTSLEVDLRGVS